MSLSALLVDFLKYLEYEQSASPKTTQNYNHYLKRFLNFSGEITPQEINLDLIRKYKLYLSRWSDPKSKRHLKRVTQNYFLIALRAFLNYLAKRGIHTLSAEKVELRSSEGKPSPILPSEDLKRLLDAPDTAKKEGLRDKAILETLSSTGLKVSELISLNRDSIDLDLKEFLVLGKNRKERTLFLSDEAVGYLKRYLTLRKDGFRPLFIRFQGRVDPSDNGENMRLSARSIQRVVEKYVKKTAIPVKATPHTLRHMMATDLLLSGADVKSIQQILGHANIQTTQLYTQTATKHFKGR